VQDFAIYLREIDLPREAAGGQDLDETFYHPHRNIDVRMRWVHVHMIEEYHRHNGHADLLRERLDGGDWVLTGLPRAGRRHGCCEKYAIGPAGPELVALLQALEDLSFRAAGSGSVMNVQLISPPLPPPRPAQPPSGVAPVTGGRRQRWPSILPWRWERSASTQWLP